jgi:hypothetical protein
MRYTSCSGFAYQLANASAWASAPNDDWEIVVHTPTNDEALAGFRSIDGVRCAVFHVDERAIAQVEVLCRR